MSNRPALKFAAAGLAITAILASPSFAQGNVQPTGGPKKSVAVTAFESPELVQGGATSEELNALLVNALLKDGRFVVVERTAIADLTAEQQLGTGGSATAETAAQTGHLLGASAIVKGTVTKFEPSAGGTSIGVSGIPFLGGGGPTVGSQTAVVEISIRVIDSSTGQIIYTGTAEGRATAKTVSVTGQRGLYQWNAGAFLKTPLGEALQDAIQKSVDKIAIGMAKVPWSAFVIDNDGTNVYITAGDDQGIQPGMAFHVYRKGKELTDPSTGVVLDVLTDDVGTIQVASVRDKVSIATVTGGSPPARGDIVKLH